MADDRWLVVGLGNPGPSTPAPGTTPARMTLDLLAERAGGRWKAHRSRV